MNPNNPENTDLNPPLDDKQKQIEDLLEGEEKYEILPEYSVIKGDLTFKIIVIGNSGVGKTCLALRALKGTFQPESAPTIGFEFLNMFIKAHGKIIELQVWDTCGQEAYQSVISTFYKRASMAILVYSITDRKSFESLDAWLEELRDKASKDVKIALVGNKTDLKNERRVTKEEALNFKMSRKIDLIFESSAKHGDNSKNIFLDSAKILYKEYLTLYKNNSMGFTKVEGVDGAYEMGYNAKLPGRQKAITLKRHRDKKKKGEDDDEDDLYDDNNMGSCTKC